MKREQALHDLEGVHTIKSVMSRLNVNKQRAIYTIHRLRKEGYVRTARASNNIRIYSISFENKLGGTSYEEVLNAISPIQLSTGTIHRIYGKAPTIEEILVYALKSKSLRTILAALALFRKDIDWGLLYRLAKANHCERQIGALYDLARKIMRVRHMTQRFRHLSLPQVQHARGYTIPGLKSADFQEIEDRWRVYLPFNKSDLDAYI